MGEELTFSQKPNDKVYSKELEKIATSLEFFPVSFPVNVEQRHFRKVKFREFAANLPEHGEAFLGPSQSNALTCKVLGAEKQMRI